MKSDIEKAFDDDLKGLAEDWRSTLVKWEKEDSFRSADPKRINKMPFHVLAEFQSKSAPGSPQHIAATFEFQRRITKLQTRTAYICCLFSGMFGLIGTALGFFLSRL